MSYYAELGEDFAEAVHSLLVFDALIYNEDRHFGIFGILRDNYFCALIGFKFERHPSINWSERRLEAIERHAQKQGRQLLGMGR